MLTVRQEQMQILQKQKLLRFEDRIVEHVRSFFKHQCQSLSEGQIRKIIQYGTERAKAHGFVSERDICGYLNLTFTFGCDFDKDEHLPWVASVLNLGCIPSKKIQRLYALALEFEHQGKGLFAQSYGVFE